MIWHHTESEQRALGALPDGLLRSKPPVDCRPRAN
jgi:hypothetical protein